jgi:endonuclease/exonuclease/phosphatase family metal-dependent hydrolase
VFIKKGILLINIAVIGATFLSYAAPRIDPELTWIISFFGLFYPVLLLINIAFIVFWLFVKSTWVWPSLICILIGWSELKAFFPLNGDKEGRNGEGISIMTYNISNAYEGYDLKKEERVRKQTRLIEYLNNFQEYDIICLQEVGDYAYDILKKVFPKHIVYYKKKGAVILSRYHITKKGEIDFGTITNSCLWADIDVGFDTIRVYSYHLQSNQISATAEKMANQTELDQRRAWYDIKGIFRKFKNKHITRSKQAEKIAAHAKKSTHKVILAGDLNDSPQSYTYHVLSDLGKDAFTERGFGLGTTYAGSIPLLRIDYIFADEQLEVVSFSIDKKRYSDHYVITAEIEWPDKPVEK